MYSSKKHYSVSLGKLRIHVVSLFVFLGAGSKYFKWQTGVQLRGNLDILQSWTTSNGLREEANMYLKKVDCTANLLAIPKAQLTKVS